MNAVHIYRNLRTGDPNRKAFGHDVLSHRGAVIHCFWLGRHFVTVCNAKARQNMRTANTTRTGA